MSQSVTTDVSEQYAEKFDNFAEVAHPSILADSRFDALLLLAIARGAPLTEKEVEAQFGELAWDW